MAVFGAEDLVTTPKLLPSDLLQYALGWLDFTEQCLCATVSADWHFHVRHVLQRKSRASLPSWAQSQTARGESYIDALLKRCPRIRVLELEINAENGQCGGLSKKLRQRFLCELPLLEQVRTSRRRRCPFSIADLLGSRKSAFNFTSLALDIDSMRQVPFDTQDGGTHGPTIHGFEDDSIQNRSASELSSSVAHTAFTSESGGAPQSDTMHYRDIGLLVQQLSPLSSLEPQRRSLVPSPNFVINFAQLRVLQMFTLESNLSVQCMIRGLRAPVLEELTLGLVDPIYLSLVLETFPRLLAVTLFCNGDIRAGCFDDLPESLMLEILSLRCLLPCVNISSVIDDRTPTPLQRLRPLMSQDAFPRLYYLKVCDFSISCTHSSLQAFKSLHPRVCVALDDE